MGTARSIGELSWETDCKVETIRYYEKIGMLPQPRRTEGGHRLYTEDHLRRLKFIRRARALGFSLDDIRNLLALSGGRRKSCAKVRAMAQDHLTEIRGKIEDLRSMETVLENLVERCAGKTVPECPIIDSLYRDSVPRRR